MLDFRHCNVVFVGLKQRKCGDAGLDGPVAPPRVHQGTWVADRAASSCRKGAAAQVLLELKALPTWTPHSFKGESSSFKR